MKIRGPVKIAIGFAALVVAAYGGTAAFTKLSLRNVNLDPIPAGNVCLIALDKDAGVQTITAEQMVQIVEGSSKFSADQTSGGGPTSGAVKKRIPVRELLGVLDGNSEDVSTFIAKMRDTAEEDSGASDAPIWTKEDIEKALQSDGPLRTKLENDVNMKVDGTPIPTINRMAFLNGIRVNTPVTLNIPNAKGPTISGFDIVKFQPKFMVAFFKSMREKFYDKNLLQSYYKAFIDEKNEKDPPLDQIMKAVFERSKSSTELDKVTRIGQHTKILVSQDMISKAEMREDAAGKDLTYDLILKLTPEGKNRLWKFSSEGGHQVIVVEKGVPIAQATIGTSLNSQELEIKQIANKSLVQEVINILQSQK